MERTVEFTGKKVQEAVDEGLKSLGITLDDADIKIINNGGLFKKAKVSITYDDGLDESDVAVKAEVKPESEKPQTEKEKPQVKAEKKAKAASQVKADKAPADEPHWGSAPVKLEPTTKSDFGKSAKSPKAKAEKTAASAESAEAAEDSEKTKTETPNGERKNKERKENKDHKKKQRESVDPTEEQVNESKAFLTELLGLMKIDGTVEVSVEEGLRINVETDDSRVIGHRGEVLVSSIINTSHGKFVHVTVDGLGYRDRRKETLEGLARRMADKAVRTRRKVTLDAMNSADRRIIHATLSERDDVFTRSEGHDPSRRVAIIPKRNNH